jgi:hypothetical protein
MEKHQLPKLNAAVFDHSLARWFSLGETRIRPSEGAFARHHSKFQPVTLISGVSLVLPLR